MNTRSSILTAALLCLGALASVPMASAQFPPDVPSTTACEDGLGEETPNATPCTEMLNTLVTAVVGCATAEPAPSPCLMSALPPVTTTPALACTDKEADPAAAPLEQAHFLLCLATANLPAALFEVEYADSDDLYPGTSSDGDGRTDYVVIHVLDPAGGVDPVLTVNLLIDLQRGTNPATTPADGPFVSLSVPAFSEVSVESISGDQQGISLANVHVQDPRSAKVDLDNDGFADLTEINCSANPTNPNSTCPDKDGDTLRDTNGDDSEEKDGSEIGTSPLNWDHDGDGVADNNDSDPLNKPPVVTDPDRDDDTILNGADNCPDAPNTDQANFDGDAQGDVCDADDDNDRIPDAQESLIGTDPKDAGSPPEGVVPEADPEAIVEEVTDTVDGLVEDANEIIDGLPVPGGVPNDFDITDRHDIDDDGNTTEPSGQVDLIEERIAYIDLDEAGSPTKEKNSDLEGTSGATLVVWDFTVLSGTPKELYRLHVGDGGQAGAGYPSEVFVLEEGPRGSPSSVTCVYTEAGQPHVAQNGVEFDGTKASEPCGPPVNAIGDLNAVGQILGDIVFTVMSGPEDPLPLFEVTDANSDGVPDFVTLNLPDPLSCTPDAQGCTDYTELVLPPEGVDPNDLCGADGTFPECLIPSNECAEDPESCLPPPPPVCDPTVDPTECAPTPEDPLAGVIAPCSETDTSQPVYICRGTGPGLVTGLLGQDKIVIRDPTGSITTL